MKKVRTRYAPSPTGQLHIGGARTALFSYLYAKHFNGDFIVRIEDTDQERNLVESEVQQLENLDWLGIKADESPLKPNPKYKPYRQSQKLKRYQEVINLLLKKGHAYQSYDTIEELESQRAEQIKKGQYSFRYDPKWLKLTETQIATRQKNQAYVIRLKLAKNKVYRWDDLVRSKIEVNTDQIGDFVIQKQDQYPTYNFAVVIDDHDMEISDVLRGEEHISNTPKQLAIYDALNWSPPRFGHLTIIQNQEGVKLSKRDTNTFQFIEDYKNLGYPPQAIFNFLALLGWTHPRFEEILTIKQLVESFDPKRLSKAPTKFDPQKLDWFAKQYLKKTPNQTLKTKIVLNSKVDPQWLELFLETYKQSCVTYKELQMHFNAYQNQEVLNKKLDSVTNIFAKELKKIDFTIEGINQALQKTSILTQKKGKNLFMPIRLDSTYQVHGPELAKAIYLFGKKTIYKRLLIKD